MCIRDRNITGKEAERLLDEAGVTVNKNAIPNDPESPFVTSGIRIGTPATTTRGMKEADMARIAEIIDLVISEREKPETLEKARAMVKELTGRFPIYADEWKL